jgi:hypothetical protein
MCYYKTPLPWLTFGDRQIESQKIKNVPLAGPRTVDKRLSAPWEKVVAEINLAA